MLQCHCMLSFHSSVCAVCARQQSVSSRAVASQVYELEAFTDSKGWGRSSSDTEVFLTLSSPLMPSQRRWSTPAAHSSARLPCRLPLVHPQALASKRPLYSLCQRKPHQELPC